jgi:hypothetical protein
MGLENFIPTIWSAKLFVRLRKSLVFASVVNQDYEGEITGFGDSVKINEIGPVSISDYTKHATLTYSTLESAQKILYIDQAKSFAFKIDDIDAAQAKPKVMDGAMSEAAYAIADTIDQSIAGLYAGAGCAGNSTYLGAAGSTVAVSSGNVIETLSYAQRYLNEGNVPTEGRWAVLPPWFVQKLVLAEVGGISAIGVPKVREDGVLMNGWVGRSMGFDLLMSNNVSVSSTEYRIMFGNRTAISYAGQIGRIEALRLETTFADAARGLYVYGRKVVRSEALLTAYLSEAAG